ncbi:MAG: hypothetical protein LHW64_00705 [Candidatus Cloacimonetes bacterium]|jgi:hypothetical protein|nr:hypothetical protein [Candidatus Cloacimonadota bacterium]MCK9583838.1 hypothetical protein [Candidatus Cloacimonadota bacterium]MDY0228629.1 hypothetical protein [Candidatus Cloacimonadaceae bacterium]
MKKLCILLILIASIGLAMGVRATGSATSEAVFLSTLYPPSNLVVTYESQSLEFFWDEPITGPPLSYKLYYSESPQDLDSYLLLDSSSTTYYNSYAYFENPGFYVTAVYSLGESRHSQISYIGRFQPVHVELMINSETSSAVLSWEPVRTADSYLVYYSEEADAAFPAGWQGPVSITENSFIDPLAHQKFYRVFAVPRGRGATDKIIKRAILPGKIGE